MLLAPQFESSVIRERTIAGLQAARKLGRKGERPPALKEAVLVAAAALLQNPSITVEDVARRMQVAPSTLYRHLPGGRSSVL